MKLLRLSCMLLAGVCAFAQASVSAYYRGYGPRTTTRLANPTVEWEVWPSNGARITAVEMRLNGVVMPSRYDTNRRVAYFRAVEALKPGTYEVSAKVIVEGKLEVSRGWNFRVAQQTIASLPSANSEQLQMLELANRYRSDLGLPLFRMDDRFNAAADAHSNYLKQNRRSGHFEREGEPGFTGVTPADRLEGLGYFGSSFEGTASRIKSMEDGVRLLFDAPYHRLPFLYPGEVLFGSGFYPGHISLKFGFMPLAQTVLSPAHGQSNVPTFWEGPENPDPLRLHGVTGRVGYPIILMHPSPAGTKMKVTSTVLRQGSEVVPVFLNTPQNDEHLDDALFIIPKQPLKPQTTYTVEVKAQSGENKDASRTWSFTTGGA